MLEYLLIGLVWNKVVLYIVEHLGDTHVQSHERLQLLRDVAAILACDGGLRLTEE